MSKAVLTVLAALAACALLSAKGKVVKITIEGGGLTAPIVETGEQLPPDVEGVQGSIADRQAVALADIPKGLPRYKVSFYQDKERTASVMSYEYDPAAGRGYVYLPAEGRWFRAAPSWDNWARRLIALAKEPVRAAGPLPGDK